MQAFRFSWQKLIALHCLLLLSPLVIADSLWQLTDSSQFQEHLVELSLPNGATNPKAILIDDDTLQALGTGDLVDIEVSTNVRHQYRMQQQRSFVNGDTGWAGTMVDDAAHYALSLTQSGDTVLGSFFSPTGKYKLRAIRLPDVSGAFIGWVYGSPQNHEVVPYEGADNSDDSGSSIDDSIEDLANVRAREPFFGNNVRIEQTIPESNVVIGEEFELIVKVTNDTHEVIAGEFLVVAALLNTATYVGGPTNCIPQTVDYAYGSAEELFCFIELLVPGASMTLNIAAIANESSYPALPSIVVLDELVDREFMFVSHNTLLDSDGDGISDFNEKILNTDPYNFASSVAQQNQAEIDVLFLYTQKFVDDVAHSSPEATINQLVQETNAMFAASGAGVSYNPVYYGLTSYQVNNDIGAAWEALSKGEGQGFSDVSFLRITQGADLVVLVDGDYVNDIRSSCGIANIAGVQSQGDLSQFWWQEGSIYSVIYRPGSYNPNTYRGCDDTVLAHELGHLMGLDHSRTVAPNNATFPWALGHGQNGVFNTIMAYGAHFPDSAGVPLFSSPLISDCFGHVCGVSKEDTEQGADAVLALNTTRFAVANYMQTRPAMSVATLSGAGTSATMLAGAVVTGGKSASDFLFKSVFDPLDAVSLVGTVNVASEHVGRMGLTHIVIQIDGADYYQLDAGGNFRLWNGDVASLEGVTSPRPLQAREDLVALRDYVAAQEGVSVADLTVYFAYSLLDTDVFVYSDRGTSIRIQP